VSDRRLGHRAMSGSGRTVGCASEIGLKCAFNSEHWTIKKNRGIIVKNFRNFLFEDDRLLEKILLNKVFKIDQGIRCNFFRIF